MKAIPLALLSLASSAMAAVSIDFTNFNFTPTTAATGGSGKIVGSVYTATNVADLGGVGGVNFIDARFKFTGASVDDSSKIYFDDNVARGDDARLRLTKSGSADIWAKIQISFVKAGTSDAVNLPTLLGDSLRLQFDDLDSDVGDSRADFAGLLTSQVALAELAGNTILTASTALMPGYTVGVLPDDGDGLPYDSYGNVTTTDPIAQSPVTVGFDSSNPTLDIVIGVTGTGTGNRHIDIDMTPDFTIIPEPSAALLCGLGGMLLLRRRRN